MSSNKPRGERLYAPDTDLMNAAGDADIPPWELPDGWMSLSDDEKRRLTKYYQRLAKAKGDQT